MNGLHCLDRDCDQYFTNEEACKEDAAGPAIRLSCPFCLSERLEEVVLCECGREPLVKGEDLGQRCLANEADDMADFDLAAIEERAAETVRQKRRKAMLGVVYPFRRAS